MGSRSGVVRWLLVPVVGALLIVGSPELASGAPEYFLPAGDNLFTSHRQASHTHDERHWIAHAQNAAFRVYPSQPNSERIGVTVERRGFGQVRVDVYAPIGQRLEPGVYETVNWDGAQPDHVYLKVGFGCRHGRGRISILDTPRDSQGQLVGFWALYQYNCEHRLDAIYGELRLGVAQSTPVTGSSAVWFPDLHPGAPWGAATPVLVMNTGRAAVQLGQVAVTGLHAGDFTRVGDRCSGRPIAPGESCIVEVRFSPAAVGARHGRVVVPVEGAADVAVDLDGLGLPGETSVEILSDPDHPLGQGETVRYTGAEAQFDAFGWPDSVSVHVHAPGDRWDLRFETAARAPLEEGDYDDTRTSADGHRPGLFVQRHGAGWCQGSSGRFTVRAVEYEQVVRHFGVDFEHQCSNHEGRLWGRLDYRTPIGDLDPPGAPTGFSVTADGDDARVQWSDPDDADFSHTVVRFLPEEQPPTLPVVGHPAYAGTGESATVDGLDSRRSYAFSAFAVDRAGNHGPAATGVLPARTAAPSPDQPEARVVRLAGTGRIETAIAVSRQRFLDGEAGRVVLARADDYADALAGTPLAQSGPVLLTGRTSLAAATLEEIGRVLGPQGSVFLLGGEVALSSAVEEQLRARGYPVKRLAGPTRYETAVAIARELGSVRTALLVVGTDFADALTAGAVAAQIGGAVLLTTSTGPHPSTVAYLDSYPGDQVAIGGPAARAHPDAEAVFGPSREATAVRVAERFVERPSVVGLARGGDFADALAGGAHVGSMRGIMLLTTGEQLHPDVERYVCAREQGVRGFVYGGPDAISLDGEAALAERLNGHGCAER